MRHGELSDPQSPNSGISHISAVDLKHLSEIREFAQMKYAKIFWAPKKICADTVRQLFQANPTKILFGRDIAIEERPELAPNRQDEWNALLELQPEITLAGLKTAAERACGENRIGDKGFLASEGQKVLTFLKTQLLKVEEGGSILCVMQSPLIEAVIFFLWQTQIHDQCQKWFPLESIRFLNYCDAWAVVFCDGQLVRMDRLAFSRFISERREMDALQERVLRR